MENAFRELGNAMVVFKSKLEEIKRMNESAINTTISDIIPKTKQPTKRATKAFPKNKQEGANKRVSNAMMIMPMNQPNYLLKEQSYLNEMNSNMKTATKDYPFDNEPTQQMDDFDLGFTIPDSLF